jgi:hypothetical protein
MVIEKVWKYKENFITSINELPPDTYGFIYITTHLSTGKKYLGKKALFHKTKRKLTKKELLEQTGRGRKSLTQIIYKESDWFKYYGSEEFIKQKIKEGKQEEFTREIIYTTPSKKLLTYFECKYQFLYNVLESDEWLNTNILGKFYKKDFDSL